MVKRGAEVCSWEEIFALSKELDESGPVGRVLQTKLLAVS